jgi:hypothetical protein
VEPWRRAGHPSGALCCWMGSAGSPASGTPSAAAACWSMACWSMAKVRALSHRSAAFAGALIGTPHHWRGVETSETGRSHTTSDGIPKAPKITDQVACLARQVPWPVMGGALGVSAFTGRCAPRGNGSRMLDPGI